MLKKKGPDRVVSQRGREKFKLARLSSLLADGDASRLWSALQYSRRETAGLLMDTGASSADHM